LQERPAGVGYCRLLKNSAGRSRVLRQQHSFSSAIRVNLRSSAVKKSGLAHIQQRMPLIGKDLKM
jgi:hypothetical protein